MTTELISADRPLLLIGCGNMGLSLVEGWREAGIDPTHILIVERDPARLDDVLNRLGISGFPSLEKIPASLSPSIIVLAVKPDMLADTLSTLSQRIVHASAPLIISVAAGKNLSFYEGYLGQDSSIVRVMPNIAVTVQMGMSVCIGNDQVSDAQHQIVTSLLKAVGEVSWIKVEEQMHAVTALSGSGPAYLFYFMECLIQAGVALGLDETEARILAIETARGAAEMASRSDAPVSQLRDKVTSPNGTTAAALQVLMDPSPHGFKHTIQQALAAALKRSRELAGD